MPKIQVPPAGFIYHGAFVGKDEEQVVTKAMITRYQNAVGRKLAWVYFSHNWFNGAAFPQSYVDVIYANGSVPYIRLMLRSTLETEDPEEPIIETNYTLERINAGVFDTLLLNWGKKAKADGRAMVVEYGTEMNGCWFAWNGWWSGKSAKPFVNAYRRIINIIRDQAGASNITWVFHPAAGDDPVEDWNRMELYYPGHDYIDWLALSAYGSQTLTERACPKFKGQFAPNYKRLAKLGNYQKPIMLSEFGCAMGCQKCCVLPNTDPMQGAADWAHDALNEVMLLNTYPLLKGFAWWSSAWVDDDGRSVVNMRVDQAPHLGDVFKNHIDSNSAIIDRPIIL